MKKLFSVVVTVYNNELNLPVTIPYFLKKSEKFLENFELEFIFVNDGSLDDSLHILKEYQITYPKLIKIINFTRNFGQVNAMMAGFQYAKGDVVGYITSDMQDPIELFNDMLSEWSRGIKLVIATREKRNEKGIGIIFSKLTHYFVNKTIDKKFPKGGYDFFLMDRVVVNKIVEINEKNGQPSILLLWLGFDYKIISYIRKKRDIGKSSWTFSNKVKLLIDIFTTNTYLPLRAISIIGIFSSFFSLFFGLAVILQWLFIDIEVKGWTSLVLIQVFFSGLIMFSLGIIGEYLWRIFDYLKGRPNYIVDEIIDES